MTSTEGGADTELGRRLEQLLERHVGRVLVASVVQTARIKLGLRPGPLDAEDLEPLVEETMLGLRMFCHPDRLPELMCDLAELCDEARG